MAQGLQLVPRAAFDLTRVYGASWLQELYMVAIPSALPYVFAATRLAVPRALLGVMIAEWLATGVGLGNLLNPVEGVPRLRHDLGRGRGLGHPLDPVLSGGHRGGTPGPGAGRHVGSIDGSAERKTTMDVRSFVRDLPKAEPPPAPGGLTRARDAHAPGHQEQGRDPVPLGGGNQGRPTNSPTCRISSTSTTRA